MGQNPSQNQENNQALISQKEKETRSAQVNKYAKAAREKIQVIHIRAGIEDVCKQIQDTWTAERSRLVNTWTNLTEPARRAMVADIREKVVARGRVLYTIIAPRNISASKKFRETRKLVEKTSTELFDTGIVYDAKQLPLLVDDILTNNGGGEVIPIGLQMLVQDAFGDVAEVRQLFDQARNSIATNDEEKEGNEENVGTSMATSRSLNSIQSGLFSIRKNSEAKMRNAPSRTIQQLLAHMGPPGGFPPSVHKELVFRLLVELRNAFLVHFAILIVSELFDDEKLVQHKYEYYSDSETDVGAVTDVDIESDCSDPAYSNY